MDRPIEGFHRDADSDWVAELSCGHTQHVRHQPPFRVREWVVSEAGRAGRLGSLLHCPACDRGELPSGFGSGLNTGLREKDSCFGLATFTKGADQLVEDFPDWNTMILFGIPVGGEVGGTQQLDFATTAS